MTGEYGKLYKRAWGDRDFKALTEGQQALYQKLVSQSDLSLAGVLTYAPVRWAGQTAGLTVADVEARFAALVERRYLVLDLATQEVLVRSYIRHDQGWRSPRTMIGIANAVRRVMSDRLRAAISVELLRLDTASLPSKVSETTGRSSRDVVVGIIDDLLAEAPVEGADTPSDTPCDTPSNEEKEGVSHTPSHTPSDGVCSSSRTTTAPTTAPTTANTPTTAFRGPIADDEPTGSDVALIEDAPATAVAPTKKGRRLAEDWQPSRTDANLAVEAGHSPEWLRDQLERFRDYWIAKSGANATKLDWDRTWRNWLKRADDYSQRATSGRPKTASTMTRNDWERWAAEAAAADAAEEAERNAS